MKNALISAFLYVTLSSTGFAQGLTLQTDGNGASIDMDGLSLDTDTGIDMDGMSLDTETGIDMEGMSLSTETGLEIDGLLIMDASELTLGDMSVDSDGKISMPGARIEANGSVSMGTEFQADAVSQTLAKPGASVNLAILFEFGSAELTDEGRRQVANIAKSFANVDGGASIVIEGHTDSVGSDADNMVLSVNRAQTVMTELKIEHGVPQILLQVGKGEAEPVASNDSDVGRALNRRVTFIRTK